MANIHIESAFIEPGNKNAEQHPAWSAKTAEPHSRKKDGGGYETVGRTFRTVKVSRDSGIDLTLFRKGDRVQVWGREVTETREHEGKKYFDLVVWADRVEVAPGRDSQNAPAQTAPEEPWAAGAPAAGGSDVWNQPGSYTDETPF